MAKATSPSSPSDSTPWIGVDSHTHFFPAPWENYLPSSAQLPYQILKNQLRHWTAPISRAIHQVQPYLRHLPSPVRNGLEPSLGLLPVGGLLIESSLTDLLRALSDAQTPWGPLRYAVVIAHPPLLSNESVLLAAENHPEIIPVIQLRSNEVTSSESTEEKMATYVQRGARAIKIHPAYDGENSEFSHYRNLLRCATEHQLPVILHTGCIKNHWIYKSPQQGHAEKFVSWFREFPEIRFVLAHMNFHDPHTALDLMEEFPQLLTDTSWQPSEIIGEAVRRVGAERILFGSDWPFIGNNMKTGIQRIQDCIDSGILNTAQAQLILGKNAVQLFKINP